MFRLAPGVDLISSHLIAPEDFYKWKTGMRFQDLWAPVFLEVFCGDISYEPVWRSGNMLAWKRLWVRWLTASKMTSCFHRFSTNHRGSMSNWWIPRRHFLYGHWQRPCEELTTRQDMNCRLDPWSGRIVIRRCEFTILQGIKSQLLRVFLLNVG